MNSKQKQLIVALDVATADEAHRLVCTLRGIADMFKVGSQLFTAAGPNLVREIVKSGERVFLDLKFHDIPNTVASAGIEALRLGVSIFNVHAMGGSDMMRRTAHAVAEAANAEGLSRPSIIAVTVLTSAQQDTLAEVGFTLDAAEMVRHLSVLAETSEMDGVVASPHEVSIVRSAIKKPGFVVVTPGVRPAGAALDDQARVMTPQQAISAGADYVVIGRPIIAAKDPVQAAQDIVNEMNMELRAATTHIN